MTNSPSPPCLSKLQQLLKLSHSENHSDQQEAVIELSKFVDGTSIAVDSFGPLAHALCRLLPSPNRTVASYSARTIKFLVLDDTLRPQAMAAGVHAVVCGLLNKWEDEILCLRELLGILQTLTWDKQCVKGVLQCSIIDHLIDYIQASDQEISLLSLATIANILSYADTLLLTDTTTIEALGVVIPHLLNVFRDTKIKNQKLYAAAGIANASTHPRLAQILKEHEALSLCRERVSMANLPVLDTTMGECVQTAIYHLSDKKDGLSKRFAAIRYTFRWTKKTFSQMYCFSFMKYTNLFLAIGFVLWVFIIIFTTATPYLYIMKFLRMLAGYKTKDDEE